MSYSTISNHRVLVRHPRWTYRSRANHTHKARHVTTDLTKPAHTLRKLPAHAARCCSLPKAST